MSAQSAGLLTGAPGARGSTPSLPRSARMRRVSMCFAAMASCEATLPSKSRRRRRRPRGCVSDAAGRTERLDVLLLGLALPRRHGRARVVLDHGAEVTCGRFRRDVTRRTRGWLPAAILQRALVFWERWVCWSSRAIYFCKRIGSRVLHFETCTSSRVRSDYFACGPFSCTKLCSNFRRDGGERCRA